MLSEFLINQFEFSYYTLGLNTENITHEESLLFPAETGNAMNWILGHIIEYRNTILVKLNAEPIWQIDEIVYYKRGSNAKDVKENFLPWQQLLNYLNLTQINIIKALRENEIAKEDEKWFARIAMHEAYHAGQIGLLRRLLGKEGKIK